MWIMDYIMDYGFEAVFDTCECTTSDNKNGWTCSIQPLTIRYMLTALWMKILYRKTDYIFYVKHLPRADEQSIHQKYCPSQEVAVKSIIPRTKYFWYFKKPFCNFCASSFLTHIFLKRYINLLNNIVFSISQTQAQLYVHQNFKEIKSFTNADKSAINMYILCNCKFVCSSNTFTFCMKLTSHNFKIKFLTK